MRCGGQRPPDRTRGFFFEPTVLSGVNDSMRIMREEPFCPIAPISTFGDFAEVIGRANATEYGLAAYVFTRDTRTAFLASEALDVGMVGVNQPLLLRRNPVKAPSLDIPEQYLFCIRLERFFCYMNKVREHMKAQN